MRFRPLGKLLARWPADALLPFIEVVRGSFRVGAGEAELEAAQKLETGLAALGLHSARNLGLLLHLLGLKVPGGALTGLDGVLIGLRTRELLEQLLEALCLRTPVVMAIEDLHWIDSASEETLKKIVDNKRKLRLLVLHSRRPDYAPPGSTARPSRNYVSNRFRTTDSAAAQARLGVEILPEAVGRQIADKAEGNPLFAEEIVSFLAERGSLRFRPASWISIPAPWRWLAGDIQSLLTARVDRLAPKDRVLLQAAAAIGRWFNPSLLAAATGEADVGARLEAMDALDLVRPDGPSGDYAFKHALVRDALYQSLLSVPLKRLHARIAEEIERRSGDRLTEVAETLAHHWSRTDRADKAFVFLSIAGAKSLGVYSLDEATAHLAAALALLDKSPHCAADDRLADFLVSYTLLLHMNVKISLMIDVVERLLPRVERLGDDPRVVFIRHQYVYALTANSRYSEALTLLPQISSMADRLGDARSRAYSLAAEIGVSAVVAPKPLETFEALRRAAIEAATATADAYTQNWTRWVIGWEELHRGRMREARDSARELIGVGQTMNDPRSIGLGLSLLSWIAITSDAYDQALEYSEQSLAVAIVRLDRLFSITAKGGALILLRRTKEGQNLLEEVRRTCVAEGNFYITSAVDGPLCAGAVLQGRIGEGIRSLEAAIEKFDKEGCRRVAGWYRLLLCDVYLQILAGREKLPFLTLLRNLPILLKLNVWGRGRIHALVSDVLGTPDFDPAGHHTGRAHMVLGLLYKTKKNRALALEHLRQAERIVSQWGPTPMLARIDAALSEASAA